MADCSYVRCMQERRYIKRELQRWYKNMVYIVGLERVAEELMGRRKWKVYQDSLEQSHVNATDLLSKQTPSIAENGHCQGENISQVEQESKQIDDYSNEEVNSKTEINNKIKEENHKLMTTETEEKLENNCESSNLVEDSKPLIEQDSKDIKVKTEDDSEDKPPILKSEKPEPVDWKPQEKCYFCVDGKLLKVNELGQLVVESEPANPDTELNKNIIESEDSSESSDHENTKPQPQIPQNIPKSLEALLRGFGQGSNMTSLESVAAHIAVFGGMNQSAPGINPFYPAGLYQYLSQLSPSPGASAAVEPAAPSSPSLRTPNNDHQPASNATSSSAEQPLDLSSKSSTPGPASIDSKHIFKAKPRLQQIPGRRSYTEEELQNALQDIISGKLGTRRAAVLYGIPRSTLRNKVYKLALEQKREAALINNPPIAILEGEDDDKDSATEDDREFNKSNSTPQSQTPQSHSENASRSQLEAYLEMVRGGTPQKSETKETKPAIPSPTLQNSAANPWIDPNAGLLSLLLAGGGLGGLGAALPTLLNASPDELAGLPDILRKIIVQQQELIKNTSGEHVNLNGSSNAINSQLLMQSLMQQNKQPPRQAGTPETTSSVDDDVILKIPSYKPVVGSSVQNKNGDANITPSTSPQIQQSVLSNSPHKPNQGQLSIIPTALLRQRSESQSPPMPAKISISEIMANSITRNFQPDNQKSLSNSMSDHMDPYKRPTLTVKTFGGPSFGNNPNLLQMPAQHSPTNTGTGGKGTRPKRGKYRNYDRDSLVEAVKAVQRGEMSVHRAGSYYGVPHSTLEYKVKERHLMRPRKREPKPQPLDDRTGSTSSIKTQDMSVSPAGLRTMDKSKVLPNAKPPMKTSFPSTSPNGLKMPMFDPAMAAQLQYTSQLFWPNPGNFPGLPGLTDFSRSSNNSSFPPNAENFFTQQMLQKLQEDQARNSNAFKAPTNGSQSKSPRELAESIYDASNTNGSFLDGIIRHTLDKKTSDITQGALFEQLLKSNKTSQSSSNQSDDDDYSHHSNKRPGSPLNFTSSDIKRERASPSSVDTDPEYLQQEQKQLSKDAMESLAKLRENLSLHTSSEELNGGMSDENFPKTEISENNS